MVQGDEGRAQRNWGWVAEIMRQGEKLGEGEMEGVSERGGGGGVCCGEKERNKVDRH
jgi:hypothetical protein